MLTLDGHPHAKAVLGAALSDAPAHAYLLHGPAGSGKRSAARAFAAELLARGTRDPENARTRVEHGTHPDLTWVAPSGAHIMLFELTQPIKLGDKVPLTLSIQEPGTAAGATLTTLKLELEVRPTAPSAHHH